MNRTNLTCKLDYISKCKSGIQPFSQKTFFPLYKNYPGIATA